MSRSRSWVLVLVLLLTQIAVQLTAAQAPQPSSPEIEKRVESLLKQMTLEEKIDYIGGVNDFDIRAIPRLNLPAFRMSDGPLGLRNDGPSTTMGGVDLAASWDPALAKRVGEVFGDDARARGVHFLLGPGVNIYRAPMNGRNFEYFGEDPFLAGKIADGYIEGLQSKRVCATIKHYMGNNSEYDRHNEDSIIDERTMREIYLPVFETAVKDAHVCSIMDSYNLTNGEHLTQNSYLNNEVAKKDWGFDGIIMSDWDSTYDGVAAVNGGLDLEMPRGDHMNRKTLLPAIKSGKVSEATIDDHVRRILRKAIEFGWLDHQQLDTSVPRYNGEGREVALQVAREGMVLLKNDGNLLPLDKSKIKSIAVIGPDAYPGQPVGGGSAGVQPFHAVSYLEGLANYLGESAKVVYNSGVPTPSDMADATSFMTAASGGKPGLRVEHFTSKDLSGKPVDVGVDSSINSGWYWDSVRGLSPEQRSARWTGYYMAKDAGTYSVFLQGPGEGAGARVYLDDKLLLDNWDRAIAAINYKTVDLTAGAHKIKVEFLRPWGNPQIRVGIFNTASIVNSQAKAMAATADAVVIPVGFDKDSETEGSDRTFRLPPGQDQLIQAMLDANKNVIVVITSGGGTDMTGWIDRTPAVLQAWYSGQEAGRALAQLVFGDYSPSGKLPDTFDRKFADSAVANSYYYPLGDSKKVKYSEGVFLGYRHYDKTGMKPLFPFGFGLSYTTFKYSNLEVSPETTSGDQPVTVSFDVTNSGDREAAEVAELYVNDNHASVPRPVKELKGFDRVSLKPGETRKVTLTLNRRALSYYDVNSKAWKAEPGDFGVLVGGSSDNIQLKGTLKLTQ